MIDFGYINSNKDKYSISGDKYLNKKKPYISSVPCSTRKNYNTNASTKREKNITSTSSKRTYAGLNSSLLSKYKNKIKQYIRASLHKNNQKNNDNQKANQRRVYTKRIIDNSLNNLAPNTVRRTGNESILGKTSSNYKLNLDLNSFDFETNRENSKPQSKIDTLRKEKDRKNEKLNKKDDKYKSIKVSTPPPFMAGTGKFPGVITRIFI